MIPELHTTDRLTLYLETAYNWLFAVVGVLALVMAYALVQYIDDNIALREQVHQMKSTGCAPTMNGRPLAGANIDRVSISRPHMITLQCFYARGVQS